MSNLPIRTILGVKIHALKKEQVKELLAEEALQNQGSALEYAKAQSELASALAQIAAINRLKKRGH